VANFPPHSTVGWVIWPVKAVPDMTYDVFGGTLSLTQSVSYMCILTSHNLTKRLSNTSWSRLQQRVVNIVTSSSSSSHKFAMAPYSNTSCTETTPKTTQMNCVLRNCNVSASLQHKRATCSIAWQPITTKHHHVNLVKSDQLTVTANSENRDRFSYWRQLTHRTYSVVPVLQDATTYVGMLSKQ